MKFLSDKDGNLKPVFSAGSSGVFTHLGFFNPIEFKEIDPSVMTAFFGSG